MSNAGLVARLRTIRIDQSESVPRLRHEAADRIEALEAEVVRLRAIVSILINRIEKPELSPDADDVLERARAAIRGETP